MLLLPLSLLVAFKNCMPMALRHHTVSHDYPEIMVRPRAKFSQDLLKTVASFKEQRTRGIRKYVYLIYTTIYTCPKIEPFYSLNNSVRNEAIFTV